MSSVAIPLREADTGDIFELVRLRRRMYEDMRCGDTAAPPSSMSTPNLATAVAESPARSSKPRSAGVSRRAWRASLSTPAKIADASTQALGFEPSNEMQLNLALEESPDR
jgi:hypothetical protein